MMRPSLRVVFSFFSLLLFCGLVVMAFYCAPTVANFNSSNRSEYSKSTRHKNMCTT